MIFRENDDVIEALAPDRADHALGVRVLPRRARCDENLGDAHHLELGREGVAVDAVAITNEVAGLRLVIRKRLQDL